MKNICFLNSTRFWGGGEKIHFDYAIKFRDRGYNVCFAASKSNPLAEKASQNSFPVFHVTLKNLSFLNPIKYLRLIRFYKKQNIDVVIISASHDTKVGAIAAKMAGVKKIVLYRALAAPVKNRFLNRHLYKKVFTHVIANSLETRRTMLLELTSISTDDVAIVYQGLDIQSIDHQNINRLDFGKDKFIIGNAGRLTRQKGQHHLIDIAKQLKSKNLNFKIIIAGAGELESTLKERINHEQLTNEVELMGFTNDVNSFMHSIDVFALTSEWEGFGYVLAEAMIASKPLVAFNITSNPELIQEGKNGFLPTYGDTKAFSDQLLLLANDKELRMKMGISGREIVEKRFQLDQIISDFEKCIKQPTTKVTT
ncbi:glycosyltransferase involved in cell wall biosynthesis [Roseivirga ehrenbergii]|uniref:Glycosyl transferase family 1 domain-containing protein n=1 Tax=Roseivirga ehrenbergii (strain DSM 102268 / JCM 13514 / KCTC 12282 / NCIMB 14502 / KMM 6017) TaxID=279360 RepID=A0A150XPJ7_ROSEK|nr:glycosyltransferase [Roseivirga ehrenbergii]KYG80575.1 hypothetical protein MB14_15615 [Roseivirga ehrenbergii]TCL07820.1 glycosyltransferase involved in cell wall biosynthesis [Roseivirga ehrenbergii]